MVVKLLLVCQALAEHDFGGAITNAAEQMKRPRVREVPGRAQQGQHGGCLTWQLISPPGLPWGTPLTLVRVSLVWDTSFPPGSEGLARGCGSGTLVPGIVSGASHPHDSSPSHQPSDRGGKPSPGGPGWVGGGPGSPKRSTGMNWPLLFPQPGSPHR